MIHEARKAMFPRNYLIPATMILFAWYSSSQADALAEESVARFCMAAGSIWAMSEDKQTPSFEGNSPSLRGMESYWRHSFQGVSVPIPMDAEGWHLFLGDSNYVKGLAGLSNLSLDISFGFTPAPESMAVNGVGELASELGLPVSSLSPIELVRLAVSIDAEKVMCDPDDIRTTIDNVSAVYVKGLALSRHDKIYLHEGGVLGHSVYETAESWTYVFEGVAPGSLFQLTIRNESPDRYSYIGFEIADKSLSESVYSPPWMRAFFEAITEPTRARLLELREIVSDYSFPIETYNNLDEKLAQFE